VQRQYGSEPGSLALRVKVGVMQWCCGQCTRVVPSRTGMSGSINKADLRQVGINSGERPHNRIDELEWVFGIQTLLGYTG